MTLKKVLKWIGLLALVLVVLGFAAARTWPLINDVRTGGTPEYPDLLAQHFKVTPEKTYDAALAVARESGWELTVPSPAPADKSREIRAVATTKIWHFKDDITIRIEPEGGGSTVNVHSRSRVGKGDFGANARRIRQFQSDLAARLAR